MPVRLSAAQYAKLAARPRTPRSPRKRRAKAKALPTQSEASLLRQVLAWLKARDVFAWRANSGGGLRGGRPVRANPEGTPDVLAVLPLDLEGGRRVGVLVGIELKSARARSRLRPSQAAWRASAQRQGVLCLVVRSLGELIEAFAKEGFS